MRIYLAGPEVFLSDAAEIAAAKKAICAAHGAEGVFPTDHVHVPLADPHAASAAEAHMRLYFQNEAHIRACDALIANLTPFRGPSADVGTVFEMGFMRALGRPVFGYANVARGFAARTLSHLGPAARRRHASAAWEDADGMAVEDFDLFDNLMIEGGIRASGGALVARAAPEPMRWRDLSAFEACLRACVAGAKREGG